MSKCPAQPLAMPRTHTRLNAAVLALAVLALALIPGLARDEQLERVGTENARARSERRRGGRTYNMATLNLDLDLDVALALALTRE